MALDVNTTDLETNKSKWFFTRLVAANLCFSLLILWACSSAAASFVTLVDDPAVRLPADAGDGVIVLTFGAQRVLVHEAPLRSIGTPLTKGDVPLEELFVVRDRRAVPARTGYQTLFSHYGFRLARVSDAEALSGVRDVSLLAIRESLVITQTPLPETAVPDPSVQGVIDQLDPQSYESLLNLVAGILPTRYSCSEEAVIAAEAIDGYFERLGLDTFVMPFQNQCGGSACSVPVGYNVVGVKWGSVRPDEFFLVGAHYDSISPTPCVHAPGANDNASGMAAVAELARVFSQVDSEATLLFVAFGGEELGLLGSEEFVLKLKESGLEGNLVAFVIMDMVSFYQDTYGVLIEGADRTPAQRAVLQILASLSATYTNLVVEISTHYWGSDHEPLLDNDMAGALIIESDWDIYPFYHSANDLLEYQDVDYGFEFVRLSAAFLASGGGIPLSPHGAPPRSVKRRGP